MKKSILLIIILISNSIVYAQVPITCFPWVKDKIIENLNQCGNPCPGDINNGDNLNYEIGTVNLNGVEHIYEKITGGSFDFNCASIHFFDFEGNLVESCSAGFGQWSCTEGVILDGTDIFNLSFNSLWDCSQGMIDCETNCICPEYINSIPACTAQYDPVCGCNGIRHPLHGAA